MPVTYTLIASNTLSSSAASVTFSAIPGSYTDLVLKATTNADSDGTSTRLRINGDTGTTYSFTRISGFGSTSNSDRASNQTSVQIGDAPSTANFFTAQEIYISSYTVSQNKPFGTLSALERNSATNTAISGIANLWRNTAAITSLLIYPSSGNYTAGSSFFLYGIKNS